MSSRDRPSRQRFARCVLAAVAAWWGATARADDAAPGPPELKVSVAVGPAYALGQAADGWARRIAEKSDGKLAARVYPGAVLSARDPAMEFVALRDGAADLAVGSTLYWSAQVAPLAVVALPWLAPEPAQLDALVAGPVADMLRAEVERSGAVALALAPLPHRELALRNRAAKVPDDLAGMKVRVASPPALTALYGALRAQPLTMPYAEAQAALAAGTVDAQDGSLATFSGMRLDALGLKWVLQWGAVAEIAVFAVNRTRWTAMSEAQQTLVRDSAVASAKELRELARKENAKAEDALRKGGMTVIRLTPAGRAAFVAATRGTYDTLATTAGIELVRAAEAAVTAAGP